MKPLRILKSGISSLFWIIIFLFIFTGYNSKTKAVDTGNKIGDQVTLNVSPLSGDQLIKKSEDNWFTPTVTLYSDKSGGKVGEYTPPAISSSGSATLAATSRSASSGASTTVVNNGVDVGVPVDGKTHFSGFNFYISAILAYSIRLGFALAALMIIYAGIKYVTSQGNQTQLNDSKEILIGAILGFALLLIIDVVLRILAVK